METKRMIRLFIPIFIEQALATIITMIGTMMVSGVSDAAISGVGLVDSINFLVMNVFNAVATGVTVVVSQYVGRREHLQAGRIGSQSIALSVEFSVAAGLVLILFARILLRALFGGAEQAVLDSAYIYLIASSISLPLQALYATSAGIMRAAGNTKTPMVASLFANFAYIGVASLCIYGLGLGVLGAGIGLVCSRLVSGFMAYFMLIKKQSTMPIPKMQWKPDFRLLAPVIKIAVPSGADSALFNSGKIILQVFLSGMGTAAIAANAIAGSMNGIMNLPGNSLGILSMTLVGQSYGAGKIRQTRKTMGYILLIATGLLTVFSGIMFLVLNPFLSLYHPSQESAALARNIMLLMLVSMPLLWPSAFIVPNMLRSVSDVTYTMIVSVASMFVVRVAGAWFFGVHLGWGVFGIWFSMVADWVVRSAFYVPRSLLGKWCKDFKKRLCAEAEAEKAELIE